MKAVLFAFLLIYGWTFWVPVTWVEWNDSIFAGIWKSGFKQKLNQRLLTANIGLTNERDLLYYGPLSLGSDGQTLLFNFDTGSDYLWAPDILCTNCNINAFPSGFDWSTDNDDVDLVPAAWDSIKYADGSEFVGDVIETTVTSGTVFANGVNILLVDDWYDSAGSTNYHGLCGLSAE